jgi:membrane protease YdiL (CAAX protease family)
VFSAVLLAPVVEEIFFRGIIQSMLRQQIGRPWIAVIITATVFGLMHLAVPYSVPPLIFFGITAGYLYERTGRLLAPIVFHMLFNLAQVIAYQQGLVQ